MKALLIKSSSFHVLIYLPLLSDGPTNPIHL